MFGLSRTGMVFKLTDPDAHARALAVPGHTSSILPDVVSRSGSGSSCRPSQAGEWEALAYEALGQDHGVPPEALET